MQPPLRYFSGCAVTWRFSGGVGIEPFLDLLEGGAAGEFLDEIKNYFVYAQIRSQVCVFPALHGKPLTPFAILQGEDSTKPRSVGSKVPLGELPNLMRALGYYPTEAEVGGVAALVNCWYSCATLCRLQI